MPHYTALLDYECRFLWISATSTGTLTPEDIYGQHPWDFVIENSRDFVRDNSLRVFGDKHEDHAYGLRWSNPEVPSERHFYWHRCHWVGLPDVAVVNNIWEFSMELATLSPRQLDVLQSLANGEGVKAAANTLKMSVKTCRGHIEAIKQKMSLHSIDEVLTLAIHYRHATTGGGV